MMRTFGIGLSLGLWVGVLAWPCGDPPANFLAAQPSGTGVQAPPSAMSTKQGGAWVHTFSICARDAATGELGVAVTSRVTEVGRRVPWVKAGVGAVATQALMQTGFGPRGLELLEAGKSPAEVIQQLLTDDPAAEYRQFGIIDHHGRIATYTGDKNSAHCGAEEGIDFCVQGNLLTGPEVLTAAADVMRRTHGSAMPLADRLIAALEAGQAAGGDKRRGQRQSAALVVADPREPGLVGDHISVSLQVAEHAEPVGELRRQYDTVYRRLGFRHFELVQGPDVIQLKQMLHAIGLFRPQAEALPSLVDEPGLAIFDAETAVAVDRFRESHGLPCPSNGPGYPAGRVDAEFIRLLKIEFYAKTPEALSAPPLPPQGEPR